MDETKKPKITPAAPDDLTLSNEAIEWLVQLQSGEAEPAQAQAFALWRGQSAAHELAAREAETIWHGLGVVGTPILQDDKRKASLTRRGVIGGGVVAFAGLAIFGSSALRRLLWDYATGIGEQRRLEFADSSQVLLNASSTLSVDITAQRRRLVLGEGQATFTVAPDAAHPFVVAAGDGETATGSAIFDIDMRDGGVFVTALGGTLSVSRRGGNAVALGANQQIAYGPGDTPLAARAVDAELVTAWRRGRMIFEGRRLDSVLAEIARYGGDRIVIVNPRLAALEVSGVFSTNDPAAVLRAIEQTLPLHVERTPLATFLL